MGLFTRDIKTLEELFDHGLKDIYYAENQILKALPKLIEAATNPQLKKGLKDHLAETENQVSRLEQIFEMREEKPKGTKCLGINGLLKEGDDLTGNIADKNVLDAAIIASAQAVEHYEITRYGALIAWASADQAATTSLTSLRPISRRRKRGRQAQHNRRSPCERQGGWRQGASRKTPPARRKPAVTRRARRKAA